MTGGHPVLVVGAGVSETRELSSLLERPVVAVSATGLAQVAAEVRRWRPAVVVLAGECDVSAEQAAVLGEWMHVTVVEGPGTTADLAAAVRREAAPC